MTTMEGSSRQPLDAEALCRMIKEDSSLVRKINETLNLGSPVDAQPPTPQPAIVPAEEEEPEESNLRMLHAINGSSPSKLRPPAMIIVRAAEKANQLLNGSFIAPTMQYVQLDLNDPMMLPPRIEGPAGFIRDPPCTEMGRIVSGLLGRNIRDAGINIRTIFASPALACLQTANEIRHQQPNAADIKIRVEPGIFDHTGWYADFVFPSFLSLEGENADMLRCSVDGSYQPVVSLEQLRLNCTEQSPAETYKRILTTVEKIQEKHPRETIVVVGHATTMDAVVRELRQPVPEPPSPTEMRQLGRMYPHCAAVEVSEPECNLVWAIEESNGGFIPIIKGYISQSEQRLLPINSASCDNRVNWSFVAEAQRPRADSGE